jgi:selenocysteine lyase/cysteine desulfurase
VIHQAVGGTDQDLVIFTGSGATAAVAKLAGLLELGKWAATPGPRPLVLVGPFEHHCNLLPWRESAADVVAIGEDANGQLDLADLEAQLTRHAGRPLVIGSFSAASNVTGILTDADRVAALPHRHGALSVWDYSAAAPYVPIRVAESRPGARDHKDAVVFSPHKLIGGPQTPGVLVVRRDLVRNRVPTMPGGGTVAYVGPDGHRYLELLGNLDVPRLPIVSFRIRHGDHLLHHELVVALLNDLFGIQARAAARAPGPYGHRLLGDYAFDPRTGQWRHHRAPAGYLEAARELLAAGPTAVAAAAAGAGSGTGDGGPSWLPPELERLRDFSLPPLPV